MKESESSCRLALTITLIGASFLACTTTPLPAPARDTEIAREVKTIAANYPASRKVVDGATEYEIVIYKPPLGYQAIYTLTERASDATLTVSLFEASGKAQRLTLLVDDAADGNLDYTVTAAAHSMRDALAIVRSGGGNLSRSVVTKQPVYNQLLNELRQEVVLTSAQR